MGYGYPGTMRKQWNKCTMTEINLKNEKMKKLKCPLCKSGNVTDVSQYENNGIFGSGRKSWKISDFWKCEDCGIIFSPILKNKKP